MKAPIDKDFGGVFAVGPQRHLVQAAAGVSDPHTAWRAYRAGLNGAPANAGEQRLYPMVAFRLNQAGAALDPELKLALRRAKVRNILFQSYVERLHKALCAAGLDPIYLKGTALQQTVYPEPLLRQCSDIDLYLPRAEATKAVAALSQAGWSAHKTYRDLATRMSLPFVLQHWATFVMCDTKGGEVDMHWLPRPVLETAGSLVADFNASADRVCRGTTTMRVPAPHWLLYETLEHGIRRNALSPLRWMLDAFLILNAGGQAMDEQARLWAKVFEIARDSRRTARIAAAVHGLHAAGLPLPESAQVWAQEVRPSPLERFELWADLRDWPVVAATVVFHAPNHLLRHPGPVWRRAITLPNRLRLRVSGYSSWRAWGVRALQRAIGRA